MHDNSSRSHRGIHPLMLVAGTLMLSRAIHRHHRMGGHAMGGPAMPGDRSFRVPPRIQAFLDEWHTRAHEAATATADAPAATTPPDAPAA